MGEVQAIIRENDGGWEVCLDSVSIRTVPGIPPDLVGGDGKGGA